MVVAKKEKKKKTEIKSRAQYACPPLLELIIQEVNEIPKQAVLPYYSVDSDEGEEVIFVERVTKEEVERDIKERLDINKKEFNRCFQGFSDNFKESLLKNFAPPKKFLEQTKRDPFTAMLNQSNVFVAALGKYIELRERHFTLRQIAVFFYHLRKNDYIDAGDVFLITKSKRDILFLPKLEVQLHRRGTKGQVNGSFLEILIGLDLDRIRTCEICSNIFWAKRVDSETCSARCFNTLRARRFRNLTPEEKAERKAARKKNRQLVKDKKAKPTKRNNSNGTL